MKYLNVKFYIGAVFLAGVSVLVYLGSGRSVQFIPQIPLNYFKNNQEVADSVQNVLQQRLTQEKYFWFGVEPGLDQQLDIFRALKHNIEKQNGLFDMIYIDQELQLTETQKNAFGNPVNRWVKEDWGSLAKEIKQNHDKKILVLTAAIYSTNLLKYNPVYKINEVTGYKPTTFSMGFFPVIKEEEKKSVFPCQTENKEGTAEWGCAIANKARSQRRKLDVSKLSLSPGLMDLTGEKDYMILIR